MSESPLNKPWKAPLCKRIRESFGDVRKQLDAAELAIEREDAEALSIALSLAMARYFEAVNGAYDMLVRATK